MACLDLRRNRLFQRIAERHPSSTTVPQGRGLHYRAFFHLAYSPFAPSLRINVDVVTVNPDTSHHVDASIPVCWCRKCFLVKWCQPFLVHMLGAANNLAWSGRQITVLAMDFLPLPRCPGARL